MMYRDTVLLDMRHTTPAIIKIQAGVTELQEPVTGCVVLGASTRSPLSYLVMVYSILVLLLLVPVPACVQLAT